MYNIIIMLSQRFVFLLDFNLRISLYRVYNILHGFSTMVVT